MKHGNTGFVTHKKGLTVQVKDNNIESAIKALKRRMIQEGMIRDMRRKEYYEAPGLRRRKAKSEAVLRERKRREDMIRNGF
jgi:small subunit ribosomal protein S21